MTAQDRGRIVWHELLTSDPAGAERFYRGVIGWGIEIFPATPPYHMWTNKGASVGGIMPLPEEAKKMGAPSNWLPYVAVPDVDTAVRQATALGARTYVAATDIPTVGRFAVLADPQGATFAVFKGEGNAPGHEGEPELGEFAWHELATTDWQAAWRFYEELFGWVKTESMDMGAMGTYQMFGRRGVTLGGLYNKSADSPAPPHWLSYVLVPNVDNLTAKITAAGGRILNGPMDVPGYRIVMCVDPQGAAFALNAKAAVAAMPAAKPAAKAPAPKAPAPKAPAPKPAAAPKAAVVKSAPSVKAAKSTPKPKAKAKAGTKAKAKTKRRSKPKTRSKTSAKGQKKSKARKSSRKKTPARRAARGKRRR